MTKPAIYFVRGKFIDKNCNEENEKHIVYADSFYNLTIEAEDMKKAHDLAMEYMPAGSAIIEITLGANHPILEVPTRGRNYHIN